MYSSSCSFQVCRWKSNFVQGQLSCFRYTIAVLQSSSRWCCRKNMQSLMCRSESTVSGFADIGLVDKPRPGLLYFKTIFFSWLKFIYYLESQISTGRVNQLRKNCCSAVFVFSSHDPLDQPKVLWTNNISPYQKWLERSKCAGNDNAA